MNEFGVSAKYPELFDKYGFTAANIAAAAKKSILKTKS